MSLSQTVHRASASRQASNLPLSSSPTLTEATVAHCCLMDKGIIQGFAHIARLPSILLSNPFPSATKGGPVRNAGKVTPPPRRHVARHLFSQIFFFYLSSEVVIVCNVAPYLFSFFTVLCFSVLPIVIFGTLVCRILKCFPETVAVKSRNTLLLLVHWLWSSSTVELYPALFLQISVLNHSSAGRKRLIILEHSRL